MSKPSNVFAALPPNAESHFRLFYYTAVLRVINYLHKLKRGPDLLHLYEFLKGYEEELRESAGVEAGSEASLESWWGHVDEWEASVRARLPLRELAKRLGLSRREQVALVLAGLVEEDIRFGSLFAALQEPLPARRPCVGLLCALAGDGARGSGEGDWWAAQRLASAGLLVVENQSAPQAEWILSVPRLVWDAMRGRVQRELGEGCTLYRRGEFPPLKKLVLDEGLRERLAHLPSVMARGHLSAFVLRGMAESGRRTIMGSLARSMRRDMIFIDRSSTSSAEKGRADDLWRVAGPVCTLTGSLPVIAIDPPPGETVELPRLTGYDGVVGVIMRREGGVGGPATEHVLSLNLPSPEPSHRRDIWAGALGEHAGAELGEIVNRFLLPLGSVHRAARIATAYALLDKREEVTAADAQLACRALNRQKLDTLAQRLEVSGGWSGLVVNDIVAAELFDLERRCRHRESLLKHLGAGLRSSVNCGVRALFNGPSGTGKTLAAKVLAAVLQTDIYRVDMASVINKYIGETEKNLSQLLARAEELDVLLLIDEGDSLMTNRTEVKSANDRYANLETNYLLQRLENYEGIVVVTTNAGNRIDTAFQRRFDVTVSFQPPDAQERLAIWHLHLSDSHAVSAACLREVSSQCSLTGGQIRNAVLYASLLALDDGRGGEVADRDIEAAVRREYSKAGASCPLRFAAARGGHHGALTQLLSEIH
ncbi:MAG TPA: ATP-binding protein [Pyrinomonadaceae bacterium]|nr:ATP-binding protein [Pyrinomonadaceae bacterium]